MLTSDLALVQRTRRGVLAVMVAVGVAVLCFVGSTLADETFLGEATELAGGLMIVTCIIGRCWCTLYLGGHKSRRIVRNGPYSISRNPLYMFSILGAAGAGALFGSFLLAALLAGAVWAVFRVVIGFEEEHLERIFGDEYRHYKADVPRFGPRITGYRDGSLVTFSPSFLIAAARDNALFLLIFPYVEFTEILHETYGLPILLLLP